MSTCRIVLIACLLMVGQLFFPLMGNARAQEGKPDLTISSNEIIFTKDKPLMGDGVQINATIRNPGAVNASNVAVKPLP